MAWAAISSVVAISEQVLVVLASYVREGGSSWRFVGDDFAARPAQAAPVSGLRTLPRDLFPPLPVAWAAISSVFARFEWVLVVLSSAVLEGYSLSRVWVGGFAVSFAAVLVFLGARGERIGSDWDLPAVVAR